MVMSVWDKAKATIYVFAMDCRNETVKENLAPIYKDMLRRFNFPMSQPILFDSAEPSSISTLQLNGVIGATKCARKDVPAQTDFLQSQTKMAKLLKIGMTHTATTLLRGWPMRTHTRHYNTVIVLLVR
jgi:hypothetical protein